MIIIEHRTSMLQLDTDTHTQFPQRADSPSQWKWKVGGLGGTAVGIEQGCHLLSQNWFDTGRQGCHRKALILAIESKSGHN